MSEESLQLLEVEVSNNAVPELKLWTEVLLMAVLDAEPWIKGMMDMSYDQVHHGRKALNWLLSERYHEGSFRWICSLVDLDHNVIRSRIGIAGKKNIW